MSWKIPGLNSGICDCFLSPSKVLEGLWGSHNLLVYLYWPSSSEVKRPGHEPNNSPVTSAEVMVISTRIPLVLRFQLNKQHKLRAVRVSGTDSTVNTSSGIAAVQIGAALLVKVSVFRNLLRNAYSLKCSTA